MKKFKFIDLFAGVGGFHQAMAGLGGVCVFASEIDVEAAKVYKLNYGINALNDITQQNAKDIPQHDVLCAGFPCQSFSKAGKQNGLSEARGTLFFDIARILEVHKSKYIILENVKNLVSHDSGNTWKVIQRILKELGYRVTYSPIILSPHLIGVPQLRERVFILGVYDPENVDVPLDITISTEFTKTDNSVYSVLDLSVDVSDDMLSDYELKVLDVWNEFYKGLNIKTIGFPIWTQYFKINDLDEISEYPKWKQNIISKNLKLYESNKKFIDVWLQKYDNLEFMTPSHRKFEWQAGESITNIYEGIVQFRPSGVRVKRPDTFPALVAMVHTPIIGKYKRRITVKESMNLQSFNKNFQPHQVRQTAYKQLGNSVNVNVVKLLAQKLFEIK